MGKEEKELQKAYSKKERMEKLLANLEKLKEEGSADAEQYESMKANYTQTLNEAASEIEQIKNGLSKGIESEERILGIYKQELKNLEVRFKVGELLADEYQKSEKKTKDKIDKAQIKVRELKRLFDSETSADVGGYIETQIKKGRGVSIASITPPDLSDITISDFKEFISPSEMEFTKGRLVAISGAALMVIGVLFLPWAWFLVSISAFQVSAAVAIFCLLLASLAVVSTFLANSELRAVSHLGTGGIGAIIGIFIIIGMASEEVFGVRVGMEVVGSGLYAYVVGGIIALVGGGIELKEGDTTPHLLATILGYIFGVSVGWIGIAFGIYLLTREHPRAKFHGKIVLVISVVMIVFGILAIILGS